MVCEQQVSPIKFRSCHHGGVGAVLPALCILAGSIVFELEAQQARNPFPLPPPKFAVKLERSQPVAMRDGVRLSTDLYVPIVSASSPASLAARRPAVLMRTPYNKNSLRRDSSVARMFASQGYVVVTQDMRGRFESEGQYRVSAPNREDGSDVLNWIAQQPWSNGRVGTYGCSYLGENQVQQATTRNPHHAAAIPQYAGGAYRGTHRYFGVISGGIVELASAVPWFWGAGSSLYYGPPAQVDRFQWFASRAADHFRTGPELPSVDFDTIYSSLPIERILERVGAPPSEYAEWTRRRPNDPAWDQHHWVDDRDRFDVPALWIDGWYETAVAETIALFNLFQKNAQSARARANQYLIIGPTTHCSSEKVTERTIVGERDLGDARLDYWAIYLRWFDHWLNTNKAGEEPSTSARVSSAERGESSGASGVLEMPRVQYYLMGKNEWRQAPTWPVPGMRPVKYYLRSDGRANSRYGTGSLSLRPAGREPADTFHYDPRNPVPSLGGASYTPRLAGSFDQRELEARHDVLVYTSEVLKEGVEVTGPLEAVLYVSSSAKDTDFSVKLVDVYPDGRAFNIQDGVLRARYREGYDRVVFMAAGQVYQVRVNLHATANWFGPGHRIRVEVSSSNFPRFDRNLNTGGRNYDEREGVVAKNVIHHSREYPSHIVLPVVSGR